MSNKCQISFNSRLDFHDGVADSETIAAVSRHISEGCVTCARDLTWLSSMLPVIQDALTVSATCVSERAMERALSIMPTQSKSPSLVAGIYTAAKLLLDSRVTSGAYAAARDLADSSVHLVYRADNIDIDLFQEPVGPDKWYLTGQALSLNGEELSAPDGVELVSDDRSAQVAFIEDSEFAFSAVPAGSYSLRLTWSGQKIQVDNLAIGAGSAEAL